MMNLEERSSRADSMEPVKKSVMQSYSEDSEKDLSILSKEENPQGEEDFSDISPYEGKAFLDAMKRLDQYPQLVNNFVDVVSGRNRFVNKWKFFHVKKNLSFMIKNVKSIDECQKLILCNIFMEMVESASIDNFTYSGLSKEDERPCIYISNHRDIILDAALLCLALYREDMNTCNMVIGNNLLVNPFISDVFKVNGAIIVNRDTHNVADSRNELLHLSRCIKHWIVDKKKSVWIAQKSGRSKDGIDNTNPSIVKMLYLAFKAEGKSFEEFLNTMNIKPVSVSYQYDPCDITKSQEVIRKLKAEGCFDVYKKKKYEDIIDMVRGVRHYKGNVNITVGESLTPDIAGDFRAAAREIDRQIHLNYKLSDTNYFCYDYLRGSSEFKDYYEDFNSKSFLKNYKAFSEDVKNLVYNQYANPVKSYLEEAERAEERLNLS